jgi:hypothetical protein
MATPAVTERTDAPTLEPDSFIHRHVGPNDAEVRAMLEAIGYAILIVGQYLGGVLVYEKAMRVSTGGAVD